jgi:hypothetical protein
VKRLARILGFTAGTAAVCWALLFLTFGSCRPSVTNATPEQMTQVLATNLPSLLQENPTLRSMRGTYGIDSLSVLPFSIQPDALARALQNSPLHRVTPTVAGNVGSPTSRLTDREKQFVSWERGDSVHFQGTTQEYRSLHLIHDAGATNAVLIVLR